ncbi:hypothetical protein VTI74DRAFT_2505 [Chaetomium olivicolor]
MLESSVVNWSLNGQRRRMQEGGRARTVDAQSILQASHRCSEFAPLGTQCVPARRWASTDFDHTNNLSPRGAESSQTQTRQKEKKRRLLKPLEVHRHRSGELSVAKHSAPAGNCPSESHGDANPGSNKGHDPILHDDPGPCSRALCQVTRRPYPTRFQNGGVIVSQVRTKIESERMERTS